MSARPASLSAKGITVAFGGIDVVKGVNLDLLSSEIHAITGENGAGKSSLAKVFAGVYQPRSGHIELDGQLIKFGNPKSALRNGVALIHQEPLTFPNLDVAENIMVGHCLRRGPILDWRGTTRKAQEILDALGLDLNPRSQVRGLSVAKQQMVEVACAMSHNAKVWIFDETTAPLTSKEADELFTIMRRLRDQGCAVGMVTHHLEEVFAVADRITVLRDGEKVAETVPSQTSVGEIIQLMVGRVLSNEQFERRSSSGAMPVLELKGFSGPGFCNVDLTVRRGEVVALAGLVGAGRTEVARALFGISRSSRGEIKLLGTPREISSPRDAIRLGIGLLPEDRQHDGLIRQHSVTFNTTLVILKALSNLGWLRPKRMRSATVLYTDRLKVAYRSPDQEAGELSGGNQQKVVLSKWLMTQPKLLILDEPTRGVDVGAKHEVHKLIREQAAAGVAVLMISSDLQEVLALSDRITVMREGRIVAEMDGATATQEKVMFAATGQGVAMGA